MTSCRAGAFASCHASPIPIRGELDRPLACRRLRVFEQRLPTWPVGTHAARAQRHTATSIPPPESAARQMPNNSVSHQPPGRAVFACHAPALACLSGTPSYGDGGSRPHPCSVLRTSVTKPSDARRSPPLWRHFVEIPRAAVWLKTAWLLHIFRCDVTIARSTDRKVLPSCRSLKSNHQKNSP